MISLTLVFILLNCVLLSIVIFTNVFKARIIGTSLLFVDLLIIILKVFDGTINNNRMEDYLINFISSWNLAGWGKDSYIFLSGLIFLLQCIVIWLVLFFILRKWVPYSPPVLLNKKEKRVLTYNSLLWRSILFISSNIAIIYVLIILNYAARLPLGFLAPIFEFGFGVRG